MNNDKSLNFFQRRKIEKLLQKGLTIDTYRSAPDYVKKDERIQRKLLKSIIESHHFLNGSLSIFHYNFVEKMFKEHKEYFDESDIKNFITYAVIENKMEYIRTLSDDEQIKIIGLPETKEEDIFPYLSESVVEKYIFAPKKEKEPLHINHFKNADSMVQLNIIEKKLNELGEDDLNKLIKNASKEVQMLFLEKHIDNIMSFIDMNCFANTKRTFINNHKELALTHFEFIPYLSRENQSWVFEQDNKSFEYLDSDLQKQLLDSNPLLMKDCSPEFISSFVRKVDNINIMKKCFELNPTLYKYISFQAMRDKTAKNIPIAYIESIDPSLLVDEKFIDLFIKSRLLSAKGHLRVEEFSYYQGSTGDGMENTVGVDIYSLKQIELIKKLSIEQITKLINIDTNYVLPYLNYSLAYYNKNETDEAYNRRLESAKNIFESIFPDKKFDDYDEILKLVFGAQKNETNKITKLGHTTTDFNIPTESLKLLFNKNIINSNSPILINSYYKSLFTGEDSSKLFKEIIGNTYGERAVKILEKRKELDVFSINSLEIFDSRILDNFSEEFVNDLISYNIRDFSTFLYIVKNEKDLALFKDYYSLLTKLIGKRVETMQKAITEFYWNKSLLNDIKDKNLTEEQINSLFIVIQGRDNKYDIKSLDELNNLNDISISHINNGLAQIDKLDTIYQAEAIKMLIFSDVFNVDMFNASIIDYNHGIMNIDSIFDLKNVERESFNSEELFILDTIVKLLQKTDDRVVLRSLAEELSKDVFVKNPIIINSVIRKAMEIQIEKYNSSLIDDSTLEECARKEEYDGVKIFVLEGEDIFAGGKRIIAHSDINAQGRDFMEHESQASMSTVSAYEYTNMERLLNGKAHFLFNSVNSEDIMAHSGDYGLNPYADAGVTHNPKIMKSHSYRNVSLDRKLPQSGGEVAFYRRTKNHEKRLTPDGRIKPSYICVVNNNDSNFSISDIPERDLEYAKKYDIPILLIKEQCYTKSGGYSL